MTDEYTRRIKKCLTDTFHYLVRHHGAKTEDDFWAANDEATNMSASDDLLADFLAAAYRELHRQDKARRTTEKAG